MATIAQSAVLVPSSTEIDLELFSHRTGDDKDTADGKAHRVTKPQLNVCGPQGNFGDMEHLLGCYRTLGFQGSHFGQAVELARKMITKQEPSTVYIIRDGEFVKVAQEEQVEGEGVEATDETVYPTLFMGITATLLGTGCREAVRFLVQEGVAPREAADPQGHRSTAELNFAMLKRDYGNYAAKTLFPNENPSKAASDRYEPFGTHKSFLSALVMSGGGPEHDIRRACQPYTVSHYASETPKPRKAAKRPAGAAKKTKLLARAETDSTQTHMSRFGNVLYTSSPSPQAALFDMVMRTIVRLLCQRQTELKAAHQAMPERARESARLDGTAYCSWSTTPSEVWALVGLWLEDILAFTLTAVAQTIKTTAAKKKTNVTAKRREDAKTLQPGRTQKNSDAVHADPQAGVAAGGSGAAFRAEARQLAESTVLYWAARQEVPIYCPSFADGDIAKYLYQHYVDTQKSAGSDAAVKLDLVRDIHSINRLAMYSKRTGMLICGGGTVKHHVCNANLMRNGADYTVFMSNGQEFDGSDAGARPEEAVSWGKIRCDGESVKVYSEVSVVLPLLVAEVFVPAVRMRDASNTTA